MTCSQRVLIPESRKRTQYLRGEASAVARGCHAPRYHHEAGVGVCLDCSLEVADNDSVIRHHLYTDIDATVTAKARG